MSTFDAYQTIAARQDGRVLTLTLNRPDKLNAVDARMHKELSTIFDEINLEASIDIVVLTGAGRAFSAGGDAAWMRELA
ncbi:MAG: enoyl-CoA hydratase/isomerase family protein, partial [Janthinobacterium lividum]